MDRTIKLVLGVGVIFAIVCVVFFLTSAPKSEDNGIIYFFYGEECPHCHKIMPFVINMTQKYPDVDIRILEVSNNQTNQNIYTEVNDRIGETPTGVPEVVAGKIVLIGDKDIPDKLEGVILEQLKKKQLTNTPKISYPPFISNTTLIAFFFYGDGCSHCEKVNPLIAELRVKYPKLDIEMLEIYHNATNQEKFLTLSRQFDIENSGIPTIFIGNRALIGDADIKTHFEESILAEKQRIASCNNTLSNTSGPDAGCSTTTPELTIPLVVASALIDSINPCAFSVLIFLLISIVAIENRRRILMVGGVYIAAVFIFYLLSGFGLFTVVSLSGFSWALSLIGATVAVVLGVISVLEVLRNQDEFLLAIPASKKEQIERYISTASLPAAFALGIFVGIFELPCTGGIYLAILGLMSRSYTLMEGLPYLVLYNFIFVLPLILILLLVSYGVTPEHANVWRVRHRRTLRFIVGLAMIAIGVIIFLGWMG